MKKLTLAILLALSTPALADMAAYRLAPGETISPDGKLDDAAWQKAPRNAQFYEHTPNDNRPAGMPTAMRIAYDDQYFYVALEANDPNPADIREPFARRDKVLGDQDFFVFYLDPTGDGKAAQFFRVNPRGAVGDGMFTDGGGEDFSPDYDFDAAGSRTENGWTAELRIPFSSLAYNGKGKDWRVMALRSLTRGDRYRLTSGPVPRDSRCFLCYTTPVTGMTPPEPGFNWSVTPQLLARQAELTRPDGSKTRHNDIDVSIDAKLRPRSDWVVDLTLNPDFSQVELDAPALAGNSRFAVFFPEKRPFFLEGADLLQAPFPDDATLQVIHTRSMTDPDWGVRASWRGTTADATVMTAQDNGGGLVVNPSAYGNGFASQDFRSQATIARGSMRQDRWQFGGVFTDRTLEQGRGYNRVIGADANLQASDFTRLRSQLLLSETTAHVQPDGTLARGDARDGHALYMDASHQTPEWNLFARYKDIGKDFRADNGFITQTGIRSLDLNFNRKFDYEGSWRERNPYLNSGVVQDRDGNTVSRHISPGFFLAGPYDSFFNLEWHGNTRVRTEQGGPLLKRDYVHLFADGAPSKLLNRLSLEMDLGEQIDYENGRVGKGGYLSVFTRIRPHERIEIEQFLERVWVDGAQVTSDRAYREMAYQWNSIFHISSRDTARLIWQHRDIARNQAAYASAVSRGDKHDTVSLVYTHRRSSGRALYVGATMADGRDKSATGSTKQRELFIKGSWQM